ncbi:MAG: cytochrome P450 [Mycobacteriales bacterium]
MDEVDVNDPDFWSFPEPFFAAARSECPVAELPGDSGYILTRYDDVRAASMKVKQFSNTRPVFGTGDPELEEIAKRGYPEVPTLTNNDPPEHTRFRKLVYKAFVPEVVQGLEDQINSLAHGLIDQVADRGEWDFVTEFSELLPILVMADALGIPPEDRGIFRIWSDNIVHSIMGYMVLSQERKREIKLSYVDFQHYFADLIEQRRQDPRDDMVSALVHAEVDGEPALNVPEILDVLRALLVAGNDTTTNLLGGAMMALMDNPGQLHEVANNRELVSQMVEEALRFVSPARWTMRTVVAGDVEVAGCPIPQGARARMGWGSANRDPEHFADPDRFDIHRDASPHMAFGHGIHFCIGKDLARAEARIAFNALFDRLCDFELTAPRAQMKPKPVPGVNRLDKLPMRFTLR